MTNKKKEPTVGKVEWNGEWQRLFPNDMTDLKCQDGYRHKKAPSLEQLDRGTKWYERNGRYDD
ncbi:MAG: hypothetical protein FJ045_06400 [Crenarchaeota archaeon]|nr:hypothetical protein [Thermoproteota archaeon]